MIYDVIIIGAGQAGLAMGYFLKKSSLKFLIIDNQKDIGDVWRKRYDSLILFTPRSYSSLPGLEMEGDQEGFPSKDEVANYLQFYAKKFNLPVQCETEVDKLYKKDHFFIETKDSILQAKEVIVATGPFHTPRIPSISKNLSKDIVQLHSSQYINQSQLNEGAVLVVGGGNSGAQIAVELSERHETFLSISQDIRFLPLSIAKKSIFWWLDKVGALRANRDSIVGRKFRSMGDPIFGYELKEKIKHEQIKLKSRTKEASKSEIFFEDGSSVKVNNIIWATGFISEYPWLSFPKVIDSNGKVKHERGITSVDGLYFLGLPWQYRRGSALLLGVGHDAEYIYESMVKVKS